MGALRLCSVTSQCTPLITDQAERITMPQIHELVGTRQRDPKCRQWASLPPHLPGRALFVLGSHPEPTYHYLLRLMIAHTRFLLFPASARLAVSTRCKVVAVPAKNSHGQRSSAVSPGKWVGEAGSYHHPLLAPGKHKFVINLGCCCFVLFFVFIYFF